ncbi:MAG: acyl-CoA dehydrogenase family protein, partial [Thermodesulfobacteriota bacterium]|nr:acyl-CoA dehydrogenase family protein [Thermodesulfobacteriota bacterium]
MDYDFNEEQELLKNAAKGFLSKECKPVFVREMEEDEQGITPELWQKMAELGWMGLMFPEEYGGVGGSYLDLTVLLIEMGYSCLPGPFFSTVILGGMTILEAGNEEQKQELLPAIAEGKMQVTLALPETSAIYSASGISIKAEKDGDDFVINGTKIFVPDAHLANSIICVARTKETEDKEDGITLLLVDAKSRGVEITPLKTFACDKQCEVVFNNVKVPQKNILGDVDKGWPIMKSVLQKAAIGKCAEMVGSGQRALELTLEQVTEREQFGVKVGSFQAVQHHCANLLTDLETSRLMTHQAAWRISEGLPSEREVAMTKAWVSDSCRDLI